jgi:hypothetical protein
MLGMLIKNIMANRAPIAHDCNPTYLEGGGGEGGSSRPAQGEKKSL